MASDEDIIVIGAGPAGLAVSASLRRAGLPHLVVERAHDVAASWKEHYDRLHLHTVKRYSSLPFSPWPRTTPRYPSRADVVSYLERYAEQHRITPRFGVEVRRVTSAPTHFTVDTSAGRLEPRFVVVATGYNGVANRPEFPGLAGFTGRVVHTEAYKDPQPYIGKRTLVVGCGNSGAEIALDLSEHGIDVAMVVRGPVHVVPRDLLGRPSQETGVMLSRLPVAVRDALVSPILRVAVGDLSRWGIVRPAVGPTRLVEETGRVPILDIGTIAHVKTGRIRVRPAVEEVLADRVRFVDGRTEPFEAIILATGYRPGLGRFIDGFESISDERGRPHRFGAETAISGLFFVGFRNPPTGALREICLEAPRVATAILANVRGS
jgi:indole-3-pyruvate monooxygenase